MEVQQFRCAARTFKFPVNVLQRAHYQVVLSLFERLNHPRNRILEDVVPCTLPVMVQLQGLQVEIVHHTQFRSLGNDYCSLNHVPQFADVARPVIVSQFCHRLLRQRFDSLPELFAQLSYQMSHRERDIFSPLTQRRQSNGKDIEAIVQVGPKLAFAHGIFEVAVSSSDYAYVNFNRVTSSYSFKLTFLKHAQELGLHVQRELADLVEKKGSAVRNLKSSDVPGIRSGESALFVTEQLAFNQCTGQGSAIYFDQRAILARAEIMNCMGQQLLAGASLAKNCDCCVEPGHLFGLPQHLSQWLAASDDLVEVPGDSNLLLQIDIFVVQAILQSLNLLESFL